MTRHPVTKRGPQTNVGRKKGAIMEDRPKTKKFTKGYWFYVVVATLDGNVDDIIPFTDKKAARIAIRKQRKLAAMFGKRLYFTELQ